MQTNKQRNEQSKQTNRAPKQSTASNVLSKTCLADPMSRWKMNTGENSLDPRIRQHFPISLHRFFVNPFFSESIFLNRFFLNPRQQKNATFRETVAPSGAPAVDALPGDGRVPPLWSTPTCVLFTRHLPGTFLVVCFTHCLPIFFRWPLPLYRTLFN